MPLAMPQPDFDPAPWLHLGAFRTRLEVDPDHFVGPGAEDEDDDPVEDSRRASQLLNVHGDRR